MCVSVLFVLLLCVLLFSDILVILSCDHILYIHFYCTCLFFFFLMIRLPPNFTPFPSSPLLRSQNSNKTYKKFHQNKKKKKKKKTSRKKKKNHKIGRENVGTQDTGPQSITAYAKKKKKKPKYNKNSKQN